MIDLIDLEKEKAKAYEAGGWRERYAIDNGVAIIVEYEKDVCMEFVYDKNDPYQDANGAMWDIDRGKWIYQGGEIMSEKSYGQIISEIHIKPMLDKLATDLLWELLKEKEEQYYAGYL